MRVGLIVLATQKYVEFVLPLIQSGQKYLLQNHELTWFVLTDMSAPNIVLSSPHYSPDLKTLPRAFRYMKLPTKHYKWPDMMIHRYESVLEYRSAYEDMDYLIHMDADMEYVDYVGDEIISPDVFCTTSPNCPAGENFWATGSFLGGQRDKFLTALRQTQLRIDTLPIQATYPEEYHWNGWLKDNPPSVVLPSSYCHPDRPARRDVDPKIVTITGYHENLKSQVQKLKQGEKYG